MALDLDNVFSQGGVKLIALLQHAARAAQADLLFVFLTEEGPDVFQRICSAHTAVYSR